MAMKCPACGGFLDFNPATQKLECPYCDSVFDPKAYGLSNEGEKQSFKIYEESKPIIVDTYLCKNCGAELCAPREQIVSFCMYCGGQATLLQKATPMQRPVGIIPFKISKEEVCKRYSQRISEIPFVPKDFVNSNFIQGFRGIYIPYWKTTTTLNGKEVDLDGVISSSVGSTEIKEFYEYRARFTGNVHTGTFDASEAFDDTIASVISPYDVSSIEPFKESYLSGFYADKATVEPEVYDDQKKEQYVDFIKKEISSQIPKMETTEKQIQEKMPLQDTRNESLLFPVWFLTWRKKNRVAYSVMNGETGALCAEVPVDFKKFFLASVFVAAIFAGIMSMIPMFIIPFRVAVFAGMLLFASGYILKSELKKINQIEHHVFDYGSSLHEDNLTRSGLLDKHKKITTKGCFYWMFNFTQYAMLFLSLDFAWDVRYSTGVRDFFAGMILFQLILFAKQFYQLKGIKNKMGLFTMVLSVAVQIGGFVIAKTNTQEDLYYYGVAAACLVAIIVNIVTSIFYINYLATRPVPNFYTREGANNGR